MDHLWILNEEARPGTPAWNMALDEALLLACREPVLRVYGWSEPAVSFGYFLSAADASCVAGSRPLVRRWTGGGIVHHGSDVTWSLIVPVGLAWAGMPPGESYAALHGLMAGVLADAGIACCQVSSDVPAPQAGLCFEAPAPGDLLVSGSKTLGAGQRRSRHGLLHQASMLLPEGVNWLAPFAGKLSTRCKIFPESRLPMAAAERLAIERYGNDEWTWRR